MRKNYVMDFKTQVLFVAVIWKKRVKWSNGVGCSTVLYNSKIQELRSMGFYPHAWSRFWEIFSSTTMTGFLKLSSKKISSFGNWEQISVEFQYCQICALAKNRQILPEIAKMALFAKNYWISLNVSMILQIVILWYYVVKPLHADLRPNLGFGIF